MLHRVLVGCSFVAALLAVGGCASEVGNDGARVGGSCVVSRECHIDARCLTGAAWPGGYCSTSCDSDDDCPAGSACADIEGGQCVVSCDAAPECRSEEEDYACVELPARGAGGTVRGCAIE